MICCPVRGLKSRLIFIGSLVTGILSVAALALLLPASAGASEPDPLPGEVSIVSSLDGARQPAVFHPSGEDEPKPLVVSLHSWSGSYRSADPLAQQAAGVNWNYIHPDFRGPNRTLDACLSDKALADIDDAIQYALDNGNVDRDHIFVVGSSGGGYAVLGCYLRTRHPVSLFLSWVPISDLTAWHWESGSRGNKYANDIVLCTTEDGVFDERKARDRSPLYWDVPEHPPGRLELYAGIEDGYTGSVPISHSLFFFNKVAAHFGYPGAQVPEKDIIRLLARGVEADPALGEIGDRAVLYHRETPPASLTIFDGGHEMLAAYCFSRMQHFVREGR